MFYLNTADTPIQLLGISGQKSNGKSTMTKLAVQEHGFVGMSLARHFKVDAVVKEGAPVREVFGPHKSAETRRILQLKGNDESREVYGEDIWIRHLEAHIFDMVEHGHTRFVISDVRYPNEVRWIQRLGGAVYRVFNRLPEATTGHASETALNGWGLTSPDGLVGFDRMIDNSVERSEKALREMRRFLAVDYDLQALLQSA